MVKKIQNLMPELDISLFPELSGREEDLKEIKKIIRTEVYWKDLPILSMEDKKIIFEENFTVESYYLREVFHEAVKATVACVTLGAGTPEYISKKMAEGEYYLAALADVYASQYVELLAEKWLEMRKVEQKSRGFFPTLRFSPGYGDFALSNQKKIIKILNIEDKIKVNESFLLEPEKTITFILGWSRKPQKNNYPDFSQNPCPGGGNCAFCQTKACLKM